MTLKVSIKHRLYFLNLTYATIINVNSSFVYFLPWLFCSTEAQPTPEVYQGEVIEMLKEFTKNRDQEQRLDAPNLEYLDKESQ